MNSRIRYLDGPPEGEARIWPGSLFLWNTQSGEVYEGEGERLRCLPGRLRYQLEWQTIHEVSLVTRGANPHAVVALAK